MGTVLFVWFWLFVLCMVPGSLIGGVIAKRATSVPLTVGVAFLFAVLGSLVLTVLLVTDEPRTFDIYVRNIALFGPPLLAATLFSVRLARRETAKPDQ